MNDRNSMVHKLGRALRSPGRVIPHARRVFRNWRIRRRTQSHPEFYRAVMADLHRRRSARGAVGTEDPAKWEALGEMQFGYLTAHGLQPHHRLLEIGCGNLRAGRKFIAYVEPGNYTGVDISPEILLAAQDTLVEFALEDRFPRLFLVDGTRLSFLPAGHFDVVHAHSVFTHTPLEVVEAYFGEVARVLKPGGFFDFTYHHTDAEAWGFLDEDFYFPTSLLLERASIHGFAGRRLDDWDYVQQKIRLTKSA